MSAAPFPIGPGLSVGQVTAPAPSSNSSINASMSVSVSTVTTGASVTIVSSTGRLSSATHPTFGLAIPEACPDVPAEVLDPKTAWADKQACDQTARELSQRFETNFKQFEPYVSDAVKAAAIHAAAYTNEPINGHT